MNDAPLLEEGEAIVSSFRTHWAIFASNALGLAILAVLPFLMWFLITKTRLVPHFSVLDHFVLFVSVLWVLALWVVLFISWTRYYLGRWLITDRRILGIEQAGLFDRAATSLPLSRVEDATVRVESVMQTFLHYGTVEIRGDGGELLAARGIPHPERMQSAIQEAIMHTGDLQAANERQRQTLKLVAHEVKGYLARNVALLSGIVSGDFGSVSDPLKGFARRALSGTREGVSALKDILENQGSGSSAASLQVEPFDLRQEARAIVERERPAASAKGLALELSEGPEPCMVAGDREKLRERVLRNLVDNAINYTRAGRVTAGATIVEGNVVFWVEDTGIGISADDMGKLFTEGGHGAHSQEINPHSTGFGLFAARQVVEAHGGRIWAESEGTGKGSRFYCLLPGLAQSAK